MMVINHEQSAMGVELENWGKKAADSPSSQAVWPRDVTHLQHLFMSSYSTADHMLAYSSEAMASLHLSVKHGPGS